MPQVEKAIIVSQWTSMLEIVKTHIRKLGLKVAEINGHVPVKDRGSIVDNFNKDSTGAQVIRFTLDICLWLQPLAEGCQPKAGTKKALGLRTSLTECKRSSDRKISTRGKEFNVS